MNFRSTDYKIIVLAAVLFLFASGNAFADSAYRSANLPLDNFMKVFMNVSNEELQAIEAAETFFSSENYMISDFASPAKVGKQFYENHKANFEQLYSDAGKILSTLPPLFDKELLKNPDIEAPRIDYRFCRGITRAFRAVALYHFAENEFEKAVKALMLTQWLAHSIARGGSYPPSLIDLMISVAVKNISVNELMWASLAAGNFSPNWLAQVERLMSALEDSQPSFGESLEWELTGTFAAAMSSILDQAENNPRLSTPLMRQQYRQLITKAGEYLSDMHERILNIAAAYRLDPVKMDIETRELTNEITSFAEAKITDIFDPSRAISRILINISMPNFSRAYDQYLSSRYREKGTILLVRFLARRKPGDKLPKDASEFQKIAQAAMPPDLYGPPRTACKYKLCDQWMTLYSVGMNQTDNNGSLNDDLILFRVPREILK